MQLVMLSCRGCLSVGVIPTDAHLPGQAIDMTGNPDGQYELSVTFDPTIMLLETNDGDNTACVLLQISVVNRTVQTLGACGTSGTTL